MTLSLRCALLASVAPAMALAAVPARAGDQVLYGAAPGWVQPADISDQLQARRAPAALLRDWQYRLEDGVVTSYADTAIRMDNPQSLMQMGTLTLGWLPDKGDLTVHRLEIYRGEERIDLIAQGVAFEVLRREQGLEQRLLDGSLTATLAVPGLREGDVLRLAYSVSKQDQALGEEMQEAQFLPAAPWEVGQARVIVSWPDDEEMYWRAEDRVGLDQPTLRDGYRWLAVDLPLAQRPPMPRDAPMRYQRPEVLRVGTFASWAELSRVMAPHFLAAAQLPAGSPVAAQAEAIMARTADPRERMAAAVRLVQDEISYLLNGLDGGNYLPQTADQTWAARYGDCKAKSVLLTALLKHMGIAAEPVLVSSQGGDAVPELLPLPLAFDHVIVRAELDGEEYWLDGTSAATRLNNLTDVPPFFWALPLRDGGADLAPMSPRDPAVPQMAIDLQLDHSAGSDFPVLFTMEMRLAGPSGAPIRAMADNSTQEQLRQMAGAFGQSGGLEGARVSSMEVTYDQEQALATVRMSGVANSMFEWRDGRMQLDLGDEEQADGFNPDRARPAWRDIPVATPGPGRQRLDTRLVLPEGGRGFALSGDADVVGGHGNMRVERHARIEDGVLSAVSDTTFRQGEIAPADLPAARREARRLESARLNVTTPPDITWRWELTEAERRERAAPLLAAYRQAINFAARDDYGPRQARAVFLESLFLYEDALADYTFLAREDPSPWAYQRRAAVLEALGRREEAIAELRAAYDIDADNGTAFALARMLAYDGHVDEARELVGYIPAADDEELSLTDITATITGLAGDAAGGQALVGAYAAERPTSGEALNADCWYRGLFSVALDDAVDLCTRAVERSSWPAAPLDSRALVRYRLGMLTEARADLDAALELAPHLAPSLYLRGIIRMQSGDTGGRQDIATALAMQPQIEQFYATHGINRPR